PARGHPGGPRAEVGVVLGDPGCTASTTGPRHAPGISLRRSTPWRAAPGTPGTNPSHTLRPSSTGRCGRPPAITCRVMIPPRRQNVTIQLRFSKTDLQDVAREGVTAVVESALDRTLRRAGVRADLIDLFHPGLLTYQVGDERYRMV